ncbi:CRISPR-associated endonuclease Cas1 [Campylobacter geochelonis]|uniref:CRISPR-associated endonuclease Cas1 n=1 Tax=Campylobacter geochelonis TaxID=1780362 RepID=A0A128EBQ0_9BACT|nr:CRISPR-associated endonuclease Cas1 [Campylobacter geochelonis]QKF70399.1 CRISPR/Cas system-associated endonuclease Cas1 (group II intron reverse transcriptase/maturase domain) [Campylobacter geochelonis]CZE46369.1 CRISPR-associated protein Cas1 [Campylobacter geochelonis]
MFEKTLEQILSDKNIQIALNSLKKTALGIDNLSELNEHFIHKLKQSCLNQTYVPEPVLQKLIPKSDGENYRKLAISSLKDKLIQKVLANELAWYFDKHFSDKSYAYRPGKSYKNAIFRLRDFLRVKPYFVIKSDIKDCFESINHSKLVALLAKYIKDKRVLNLVEIWIKNGIFNRQTYIKHSKFGIHQGDVLSPLLANIYLNQMDKFLETNNEIFIRYADDFVILADDEKFVQAKINSLKTFLSTIDLSLKDTKTAIYSPTQSFEFLGVSFYGSNLSINEAKFDKIQEKIYALSKSNDFKTDFNSYIVHLQTISLNLIKTDQTQLKRFIYALKKCVSLYIKNKTTLKTRLEIFTFLDTLNFALNFKSKGEKDEFYNQIYALTREKQALKAKPQPNPQHVLNKKKKHYLEQFAQNSLLHISTPHCFLGVSNVNFVIRYKGKVILKVRIDQIHQIIIACDISLSTNAIKAATKRNISIDFLGFNNQIYASLFSHTSTITPAYKAQIDFLNSPNSLNLAKEFIKAKATNQINYLKYLDKHYKILASNIDKMHKNLKKALISATTTSELMGYEGAISSLYFDAIASTLEDKEFKRVGKGATDLVNSLLNYGYAILYSTVQSALIKAGLYLNISYFHVSAKFSLSFDFIEEFRVVAVDRVVFTLLHQKTKLSLKDGLLDVPTKKKLTQKVALALLSTHKYKNEELNLEQIIQAQAYLLRKQIFNEAKYKGFLVRFQG